MTPPGPALAQAGYEQRRAEELRRWKRRANAFLLAALFVFLASHLLGPEGGVNGFVRAASEAALIGGIADWFAVTALFRHPLGIPIPHTALIPRSKDEIGRGLAEFVQQNFLDPSNLRQWLAGAGISHRVATWLTTGDHSIRAARRTLETAAVVAGTLDDEKVTAVITEGSLDWLRATPVAPLLSLAVDAWLKGERSRESIGAVLRGLEVVLVDNLDRFKASFSRSAPWWIPGWVEERIFERIVASFRLLVDEVASHPDHPVRADIERILAQWADDLRNSPELAQRIEETKARILDTPELQAVIESQWQLLRRSVEGAASQPGSELERRLAELIEWWAGRVLADPGLRETIDAWLAGSAERLAQRWDDEVIGLVETTVARWDATEISHRLELQLGRDLQFVRINGTVVGGLVGVAIHALLLVTDRAG